MKRQYWLAIAGGLIFTIIYLLTLTEVHTFDALSYIFDVTRKPWQEIFHPHHLAYGPVGAIATWLAGGSDAAHAMQRVNAIAGGTGVAWCGAIAARRWQRSDLTIVSMLALGGSYAFWYYAVEVEVYTLATFFLIGVIWMIDTPAPRTTQWALGLGAMLSGALLFHQTNVLLAIPLLVVAGTEITKNRPVWRPWFIAGLSASAFVLGAYLWVMVGVSGFRSSDQVRAWVLQYANTGWWGGRGTLADLAMGISNTVASLNGGFFLLIAIGVSLLAIRSRQLSIWSIWLSVWLLVYGGFFFWWEPDNIEFWIGVTPVAVLLLITPLANTRPWRVHSVIALTLSIMVASSNYGAITLRGDARTDLQRTIASAVAAASQPADLLLIPDGLQELYLPYYHNHAYFLSVNALMTTHQTWAESCTALNAQIDQTQQAGAAVIVAADFLTPSLTMQKRFGIAPDAVTDCLVQILPNFTPLPLPTNIPSHLRLAPAGAQLMRGAWRTLNRAPLGWTLTNATPLTGADWTIQVDNDPALVSPMLDIPMPQKIVITMESIATADQQAQLFVTNQPNQFNEARSIRWQLQPGVQRYTLNLRDIAALPTRLIQLRLDPVANGNGGRVTIRGIDVVP
jgi:hypothetical protein